MATVNRPPFWVPRPAYDEPWQMPPEWLNSSALQELTNKKFFGAGGQVPTKQWLPYLTYDDPPMWPGPIPEWLNSGPISLTNTQVKVFGQHGQAPTKRWAPYLNYDDPPMWQGAPLNSGAIMATKTQLKVFGQPGQGPTKNWLPYLTYDDASYWSGAPVKSPIIAFLTQQKVFGAGGQVPPFRPNFTYDDASPWQWPLYERNRNVLFVLTNPFANHQWQWSTYDDASFWAGEPQNSAAIPLLTQQNVFGQGGQVPPFRANFTYDDASIWQGAPRIAISLGMPGIKFYGQIGQVVSFRWNATYDDASFWAGEPINSAAIQLLTAQKIFGVGGQVPPYRWNYALDDPPSWQPWIQTNINLPVQQTVVAATFYAPRPGDDPYWVGNPSNSVTIRLPALAAFSNRQTYWYSEDSFWKAEPINSAPLQLLTAQKIFGAGGQVPPFRWNYTYDDASFWAGEPQNSAALQLLTQQKIFGAGGQVVPFRWNYTIDDASTWQSTTQRNTGLLTLAGAIPMAPLYVPRPGDDQFWQGSPVSSNIQFLPTGHNPFSNRQTWWYSEDSFWQGSPVKSPVISFLTQQKVFGVGGQVPPYRWNYTLDDPPPWQWPLYERNPNVLIVSGEPFNNYKTYWYSEDSFWQGSPLNSRAINVTTTQVKVYGQPGQAPPYRWNATYDDASTWQWPLYERNPNLLKPANQPFVNPQWQWMDDPAFWQGSPLPSVTITLTSFSLYKPGFAFPSPPDDHSAWPAAPLARNLQLLQTLTAFSNRQAYWYSEDAWWNAKPVRSAVLPLLTQQKIFGQGGQVVPFRWNYTIDDPPMWPGPVPRGSAAIQLPVTTSFFGQAGQVPSKCWAQFYTIDIPPMWQGAPASFNYLLTQPQPPAKPSGNDWIDFRRRARRR